MLVQPGQPGTEGEDVRADVRADLKDDLRDDLRAYLRADLSLTTLALLFSV